MYDDLRAEAQRLFDRVPLIKPEPKPETPAENDTRWFQKGERIAAFFFNGDVGSWVSGTVVDFRPYEFERWVVKFDKSGNTWPMVGYSPRMELLYDQPQKE